MSAPRAALVQLVAIGLVGYLLIPWYALRNGFLAFEWLAQFTSAEAAPALLQVVIHGKWWLVPPAVLLLAAALLGRLRWERRKLAMAEIVVGAGGFTFLFAQGFAIGATGWDFESLASVLPALQHGQSGMGLGALIVVAVFAAMFASGLAGRGLFQGDSFVATAVVGVSAMIGIFTVFPLIRIVVSALAGASGAFSLAAIPERLFTAKIWSLGCTIGASQCGVAWNTLALAVLCAMACTAIGLAFALIAVRTGFRQKRLLRALTILPIITPPFVVGLGLILVFGRSGLVNQMAETLFGWQLGRWIYGLPGVLVAQVFAFTPIAFLVLIGVVEGVSPSLEEAAQTMRANRWRVFLDISLPLMRPGLANAFLISFIESIADFGNPILLGGNFGVLSTEIFFSVVGAQLDPGRAATLAMLLLLFAFGAFELQRAVLRHKVYTSLSGRGDSGLPTELPGAVRRLCYVVTSSWVLLTIVVYLTALAGGFVETWGRDYSLTLRHYAKAFGLEWTQHGILWTGAAWGSFWTTVKLSAIAAPLTAAIGILTAYLLTRQRFAGLPLFEFATMLSFAVPGTVIGVAYILAFNVPPIEITGTAAILVACNIFRNMPVGVRAGIASMSQIDRSLDEASTVLGAGAFTTLRAILLPLLKPALVAALVYSFVRAMTALSAVIFLVSAEYEWATTYIVNRVINGDYGVAIAYCSVLIALMLVVIAAIQWLIGERRLGRRAAGIPPARIGELGGGLV